ncbi:MAG: CRISPR-associated endonuclease Cas2 [Magnetococcales bacterium]|nr:CRISPR-associated endonuclease Cas2 [Magnetococcales bacterium]
MDVIIAYDIHLNKTRRAVLKILREWRLDGQKSVHECRLMRAAAEELFIQLGSAIHPRDDSLLLARVDGRRRVLSRGTGRSDAFSTSLRLVG